MGNALSLAVLHSLVSLRLTPVACFGGGANALIEPKEVSLSGSVYFYQGSVVEGRGLALPRHRPQCDGVIQPQAPPLPIVAAGLRWAREDDEETDDEKGSGHEFKSIAGLRLVPQV